MLQGIKQEIQDVRLYFGQTIAYYFYFLGLYTRCLAYPALWGVVMPKPTTRLVASTGTAPGARECGARARAAQRSEAKHSTSQHSRTSTVCR